jgi:hypothetical protein
MQTELLNRQWNTRIGLANAIFDCLEELLLVLGGSSNLAALAQLPALRQFETWRTGGLDDLIPLASIPTRIGFTSRTPRGSQHRPTSQPQRT